MAWELHEECGVFGIYSTRRKFLASDCYYGLFALQHRGQESCGIAVCCDGKIASYKDNGVVNDVFGREELERLGQGQIAVGHVRYGTKLTASRANAQPMVINHIKGSMAVVDNGSILNAHTLRRSLELKGNIFQSMSDCEVIAAMIIQERLQCESIAAAVQAAMVKLHGAYSFVLMSDGQLIGARDPQGFRPLVIGRREQDWILASETCALDAIGADFVRDVEPGEIIRIDEEGLHSTQTQAKAKRHSLCCFEYVYFSRPDSVVDGTSVHLARKRLGAALAKRDTVEADIVIGVPDSGTDAAMGYAEASGIPYGLGFIKNKYIGRTFIETEQSAREDRVRIKLNAVESTVRGKRVIMVDDSIVRGTTCARIVRLLRAAGAKEIHVRSSAPPFLYPCHFGTDITNPSVLIAVNRSNEEIAAIIGADSVAYLEQEDIATIVDNPELNMCEACFSGQYPLDIPDDYDTLTAESEQQFLDLGQNR